MTKRSVRKAPIRLYADPNSRSAPWEWKELYAALPQQAPAAPRTKLVGTEAERTPDG
jgi:hypothetical protein